VVSKTLFSSETGEWETPQDFFDQVSKRFNGFDIDAAASHDNAKCATYFTKDGFFTSGIYAPIRVSVRDALQSDWGTGNNIWLNSPYGRGIGAWVEKASIESCANRIVMLLPARTCTKWFHKFLYKQPGVQLEFIKGRLKFGGSENPAPFPSMLAVLG